MNDTLAISLAFVAGMALGAFFFGGLWWTVKRGISSPRAALWFVGSMIVRIGAVLIGFYWVGGTHFQRFVACCLGFFLGRVAVTWLSRPPAENRARQPERVGHAPEP